MLNSNNYRNFTAAVILILCSSFVVACGKKDDNKDDDDPNAATVTQNSGQSDLPTAPQAVLNLFQDTATINPSTLNSGGMDCLDISKAANFADAIEPWPAGLKAFLASELAKFPEFDLVTGSVEGIFLAKGAMLSFPDAPADASVAGLMCGATGTIKNYVFLNYQLYVTERLATGPLEVFQNSSRLIHPHVLSEHGDQALYTLIHEVFHAIDQTYFFDHTNNTIAAGRADALNIAWTNEGQSIDPTAEIFARTIHLPGHICTPRYFSLTPESPAELAAAYRLIAESTSFISPYAQTNPFEDFADTLSTWYFKKMYDNGLIRSVYQDDLTATPLASASLLYKFDTKSILQTSARHQTKMCAMVDLVFANQECLAR